MSTAAAPNDETSGFAFVELLARELSAGRIDLPGFPDVALRVRKALQDEDVTAEKVTRIVGAEPALVASLLKLANSAAINSSGKRIVELRLAIARIGFNLVRSSAVAFSMAQMAHSASLRSIREPLRALWQRSALVAALSSVVARRLTRVNPDTAALAGILHGLGKMYILVRSVGFQKLFADAAAYQTIVKQWHSEIAKALLENWEIAEDVVAAVHHQEDLEYLHEGPADLTDVLVIANLLADSHGSPEDIELNFHGVFSATAMRLDSGTISKLLTESKGEIEALRNALGS
jgi:HD-like signal output (HDOD) protein